MKKYYIFLFIILGYYSTYSQNLIFKPLLGVNICSPNLKYSITNKKLTEKKIRPGFDVGLNAEIKLNKTTSIEGGWIFSNNRAFVERIFYPNVIIVGDYPRTKEDYTLNQIKLPINVLFKQNNHNPLFIGIGPEIKININAHRDGKIVERYETYSTRFRLDTKSGNKTGLSFLLSAGKELSLGKSKICFRLNIDTDITKWRYPTNFEFEEERYFSFRNNNFSLLFSYIFDSGGKK
ncbi:MAG: outer membrane beta-barrel protein [Chitinophagaceae bacterium]